MYYFSRSFFITAKGYKMKRGVWNGFSAQQLLFSNSVTKRSQRTTFFCNKNKNCPKDKVETVMITGRREYRVATFESVQNSLTFPWHLTIFPWQFIKFFEVKSKVYPQKWLKIPIYVKCFCQKAINVKNSTHRSNEAFWKRYDGKESRLSEARLTKISGLEKVWKQKKANHF